MIFIGMDLHGTMLNKDEEIPGECRGPLRKVLSKLKPCTKLYLCTGNDLTFVKEKIPPSILELFDGYVLETGAVISSGDDEKILCHRYVCESREQLESKLKAEHYPEVSHFGRRLTNVALFVKQGISPERFAEKVEKDVERFGYNYGFYVKFSSVAVDVIPRGFNKFQGMKEFAGGNEVIGIADSMNDYELISKSDYSFVPANVSERVLEELNSDGLRVCSLANKLARNVVMRSPYEETAGLISTLNFIYDSLQSSSK